MPEKGHDFALLQELMALRGKVARLEKQARGRETEAGCEDTEEIAEARRQIFRTLIELMPQAVTDAKKGKPALLRLICRTLRLR